MQRIGMMAALVAVSACGGGSAAPMPDGPLKAGVIAGNNQVVAAAPQAKLPDQVVAQVVRLPNGQVSLRILDAVLPPKAYAQTAVVGVANQPVCQAQPKPGERALKADIICATSDATGKAYLTFLHDSVAGKAIARIGVSTATGTLITDSVSAIVTAGAASPNYRASVPPIATMPDTVPATSVVDAYGNAVPFRIVSDGRIVLADTTTGSVGARTIVSGPVGSGTGGNTTDYVVELRGANNLLVGRARYRIPTPGTVTVWSAAGVNQAP